MKTLSNKNGSFVLPFALFIALLVGFALVTPNYGYNQLQSRRLLSSTGDLALKVSNEASMGSSLRNSAAINSTLNGCITGGNCTAGGPYPFYLASPVFSNPQVYIGGPAPNGILYDPWEQPCTGAGAQAANSCPISVTTQFNIVCSGGSASCPSTQASIQVSFTIQKTTSSTYPGAVASVTTPLPVLVPVPCISLVGPTDIPTAAGVTCY